MRRTYSPDPLLDNYLQTSNRATILLHIITLFEITTLIEITTASEDAQ
jgi:hypothetical protein